MQTPSKILLSCLLPALFLLTACIGPQQRLQEQGLQALDQKQYPQALDKFKQALTYDQFNPLNNYYAGVSYLQLGQLEQAEYHLRTSWQADPGIPEVKNALTETLVRQGKPNLALDFLERDAEYTKKVRDPRAERQVDKRRYVWETEERMFMGKAGDRLRIAETYVRLGDFDSARIYFEQARQMEPKDPRVLMAYGLFFDRIGDKASAAELLKAVYRIDPSYPGLVPALTRNGVAISDLIAPAR